VPVAIVLLLVTVVSDKDEKVAVPGCHNGVSDRERPLTFGPDTFFPAALPFGGVSFVMAPVEAAIRVAPVEAAIRVAPTQLGITRRTPQVEEETHMAQ
jgi:hypothetical protein